MFISPLTLNHFIKLAPVWKQNDSNEDILKILLWNPHETIIVLNGDEYPLGVINSFSLMSYLFQQFQGSKIESLNFEKKIESCLNQIDLEKFIKPIIILPAYLTVVDFLTQLQRENRNEKLNYSSCFVLVNSEEKYLGILNPLQILQNLVTEKVIPKKQEQSTSINYLSQILEKLNFPTSLYTEKEEVIFKNKKWQEYFNNYQLPSDFFKNQKIEQPKEIEYLLDKTLENSTIKPVCLKDYINQSHSEMAIEDELESNSSLKNHQTIDSVQSIEGYVSYQEFSYLDQFTATEKQKLSRLEESLNLTTEEIITTKDRTWQMVKLPLNLNHQKHQLFHDSFSTIHQQDLEFSGWLLLAIDITEQYNNTQELTLENADLTKTNQLKDDFLVSISHELKSPVTSIVALSSLLKNQKIGELNLHQLNYVNLLHQSGRKLMMLVNDLLDMTRLETGNLQLTIVPIDIKSLWKGIYNSVTEKYQNKINNGIKLILEIKSDLEIILADELRLEQILINLLDNAVKFTSSEGTINLKLDIWGNWIAIIISYTGIGIPYQEQYGIFEQVQPHYELESTGIELMFAQKLAKLHGGDISFKSTPDEGSEFTILIPRHNKKIESEDLYEDSNLILIVDFTCEYIDELTDQLKSLKEERIIIARNEKQALEKARLFQPSFIFIKPIFPLFPSNNIFKMLKSDEKTKIIPTIVLARETEIENALKIESDDLLKLPIEKQNLQKIIGQKKQNPLAIKQNLTILCLHPSHNNIGWVANIINGYKFYLNLDTESTYNYRVLEADDLDQAELLANVWQIDVVILDGSAFNKPEDYMESFAQNPSLASLPLVTLDATITAVANQIDNLSVFPCLVPSSEQSLEKLWQVISIAIGLTAMDN